MIVKAQLSLNDGGKTVLIYNEDHSVIQQFPILTMAKEQS